MRATAEEQAYVDAHPITSALKKFGATDAQLASLIFRSNNTSVPFEYWSYQIANGLPIEAYGLVKAYCALKWLTFENPPDSEQKRDAFNCVAAIMAAPDAALGQLTRVAQSKRAAKPRGRVGDKNMTVGEIVKALCLKPERQEETAGQLWNHFVAELDINGLEPKVMTAERVQKSSCEYDFKDRRKSISYGQFANLVSKARASKKSG